MTLRSRALVALTALLPACPGGIDNPARFFDASSEPSPTTDAPPPTDTGPSCVDYVERTLLPTTCATGFCHDADEPAAGLDLASPGLARRLVGVRASSDCRRVLLIDPAHPELSLAVVKVSARPGCGSRMPLGEDPLDAPQMECVRAWAASLAARADAGSAP